MAAAWQGVRLGSSLTMTVAAMLKSHFTFGFTGTLNAVVRRAVSKFQRQKQEASFFGQQQCNLG